ncbi:MAG: hypothetical protein KAR20_21650, partial [Candidatus Heimdallarchaeota archaeon]|nr:hypothetical protein [Candidatus Heimdallarchaeota archaeon]
ILLNKKLKVYGSLKDSLQSIEQLLGSLQQEGEIHHESQQYFTLQLDVAAWQTAFRDYETAFIKYLIFKIRKNMLILDDPLGLFYYQLRSFVQIAEMQGNEFIPFYNAGDQGILKIQCCDPSEYIKNIITIFHSAIGMSATMDPIQYYRDILGFPDQQTRLLEVSSPFSSKNREVIIIPNISTYYSQRSRLYPRYAEIIKNVISIKEGNYIVFCPSFEFLQNVRLFLGHISSEILLQHPQIGEEERDYLISQLRQTGHPKVLLAVMGGIFSEGFDYRGDMCIGVIVFSPALPQITYQRELIRQYYENKWGDGFSYAYTYPGINKVIQSAGRLIRSHQDKGIIVLAGERFAQEEINQLFPAYWFGKSGDVIITEDYKRNIADFWKRF